MKFLNKIKAVKIYSKNSNRIEKVLDQVKQSGFEHEFFPGDKLLILISSSHKDAVDELLNTISSNVLSVEITF